MITERTLLRIREEISMAKMYGNEDEERKWELLYDEALKKMREQPKEMAQFDLDYSEDIFIKISCSDIDTTEEWLTCDEAGVETLTITENELIINGEHLKGEKIPLSHINLLSLKIDDDPLVIIFDGIRYHSFTVLRIKSKRYAEMGDE